MVVKAFEIKKYDITSLNDGEVTGYAAGGKKAWIDCFDPQGKLIGLIYFTSPDKVQPPVYNPDSKWKIVAMYFDIKRFSEVIATLRYAKPVWFSYNLDESTNKVHDVYISTNQEPVGEQEGV
jgi:hypothetical protein